MERYFKIIITGLMLALTAVLYGQRGMMNRADISFVKKPGKEVQTKQSATDKNMSDTLHRYFKPHPKYDYGWNKPYGHDMWNMPSRRVPDRSGTRRFQYSDRMPLPEKYGFGRREFMRPSPPDLVPERQLPPFLYRIPDLTEEQKKEVETLNEKFRNEMNEFRKENLKKVEEIRESYLNKIRNLLTPEQKRWLENRMPSTYRYKKV